MPTEKGNVALIVLVVLVVLAVATYFLMSQGKIANAPATTRSTTTQPASSGYQNPFDSSSSSSSGYTNPFSSSSTQNPFSNLK